MDDDVKKLGLDRGEYEMGVQRCKDGGKCGEDATYSFLAGFSRQYQAEANQGAKGAGNEHN